MADSAYDIKQKLLQIQNQLLKDATEVHTHPPVQPSPAPMPAPAPTAAAASKPEDIMSVLNELRSNQQKILNLLIEINGKLK